MLVTVWGIIGGVFSDVQSPRKKLPMLVTVLGIIGDEVSVFLPKTIFPLFRITLKEKLSLLNSSNK
jgi:hypothetical protein